MGPLAGIRVLDLSSFLAGPFAAMILGDMGAEVLKVEPPGGDLARRWSPYLAGEGRFFQGWNRNKRGMAVDLTTERGREVVQELARRSDVVIENFRRGVTRKLGIDYETLSAVNPRLVYCSCTAFGSRGPQRDRPGYDPVLQTISGTAIGQHRYNGGITAICVIAVSDYQAGMLMVAGACAALYRRELTGRGQLVETSLLQAVMTLQAQNFVKALDTPEQGAMGIYPYRLFETADGHIFIAGGTDRFWQILCDTIGLPELGRDQRYATNGQRVNAAGEISARLEPLFRSRGTAEWEELLVNAGVPCGGARTYEQFFDDPQVAAMGMNQIVEHPTIGRMRVIGVPVDFSDTPGAVQGAAPALGQHTDEVLREIGWESQIAELRADGVVR